MPKHPLVRLFHILLGHANVQAEAAERASRALQESLDENAVQASENTAEKNRMMEQSRSDVLTVLVHDMRNDEQRRIMENGNGAS